MRQNTGAKEMLTVRIKKNTRDKLAALVASTGRSQTFLVEEALEAFCDLNAWQIMAIQEGIQAVETGRVIAHEEIKRHWENKRKHPMV